MNLRTHEILSYINDLINTYDIKSFFDLDQDHKEHLSALCIQALDGDLDIVLDHDSNMALSRYLIACSASDKFNLLEYIKKSAIEKFEDELNLIIEAEIHDRFASSMHDEGHYQYQDQQTGEYQWI
jgi:hypothetical protein